MGRATKHLHIGVRALLTFCIVVLTVRIIAVGLMGRATYLTAADKIEESKPKVAVFPIGGNSDDALRTRCAFSFRQKLDRDGTYEPIDGPRMKDLVAYAKDPVTYDTASAAVRALADGSGADILIWGDLSKKGAGNALRLHILDLRDPETKALDIEKAVDEPTDLRFAVEQTLQQLPGVKVFEHPNESSITHDAEAEKLWASNPNLVGNGDFADGGGWQGIYEAEKYTVAVADELPPLDKVSIYRDTEAGKPNNVLAMNLSKECAENNGMACLSDPIKIEPHTRYRLSYRYKSDGPSLHVFVKGYTTGRDIKGDPAPREIYRRQVPPSGPTGGKWVTVVDDLNPQHVAFPVETLRIDLYAYLGAGTVEFDDVVLKAVGKQTDIAKDDAIKPPPAAKPIRGN